MAKNAKNCKSLVSALLSAPTFSERSALLPVKICSACNSTLFGYLRKTPSSILVDRVASRADIPNPAQKSPQIKEVCSAL